MSTNTEYPEILQSLKDSVIEVLSELNIDNEMAKQAAHDIAESIRLEWGGMAVYICKGQSYELSKRDLEIWNKFNGRNHNELCREYKITMVRLYKIIKNQRAKNKSQTDLFN